MDLNNIINYDKGALKMNDEMSNVEEEGFHGMKMYVHINACFVCVSIYLVRDLHLI